MSSFEKAIDIVFKHEGLFVNDPGDPGGATKFGVSLRWLKQLGEIDMGIYDYADNDKNGSLDINDIKNLSKEAAAAIYKKFWWDKYPYGKIQDQALATKIFDLAINMGPVAAHKCLQRAIRAAIGAQLEEDGIFGLSTLTATNKIQPIILIAALRSEAAGFYRSLNKPDYLKGWLNRAYA